MEKEVRVKLKPKQLASISQIQQKKNNLKSLFEDLNQQEAVILDLILEDVKVDGVIASAKLEESELILTVQSKAPAGKGKSKKEESKEA